RPMRACLTLFWLRRAITSSGPCGSSDNDLGWCRSHFAPTREVTMKPLALTQVPVQRLSLTSDKPFATVLAAIRGGIGHPDMTTFWEEVWNADSFQKVESIVKPALGPTGLMQFG